jgi:sec-independent protein translocase protein TatC
MTEQSFAGHVQELRRRIMVTVLVLLAGAGAAFIFREPLVDLIVRPLDMPLFYSSPGGSLDFVMQLCVSVGAIIALPVLVYNLIRFIEPALMHKRVSRKSALLIIISSVILAGVGIWFAYTWVLPTSFHFFAEFSFGPVKPLISTTDYMRFVLGCLVMFAIVFQVPLVLLMFNNIRRFPPNSLSKYHKHVFIAALVIALVMPFTYDPITMFIIALPIVVLYELSVFLIWFANRKHNKKHKPQKSAHHKPHSPALKPVSPPVHTGNSWDTNRQVVRRPIDGPKRRIIQL